MAVRFDATTDRIIRTANVPSRTAFTMCGYVMRVGHAGAYNSFAGLSQGTASPSGAIEISWDAGGALGYDAYSGFFWGSNFSTNYGNNVWFFWALVGDASNGHAYAGDLTTATLQHLSTAWGSVSFAPTCFWLGNNGWGEGANFRAANTMVFDVALTAAELEQLRWRYVPTLTTSQNVWSPHFAGATERLADYSGNGRNWTEAGTLTDEDGPPISWGAQTWVLPYVVAAGGGGIEGEAAITLDSATLSATGTLPITGTATPTLAAATLSATATATLTLYADASTADGSGNTGLTTSDPVSLADVVDLCVPGTTVLLIDGTFQLDSSLAITLQGTADAWITFQPQNPGSAVIEWTGVTNDPMFYLLSATGEHCCFIEINGLIFDGANVATNGIFCQKPSGVTGFHPFAIRIINNEIRNVGASGIATIQADYIHVIGNKIHHVGMVRGWGSGISLNTNIWADNEPTFHNLILNNIISGVYDCCGTNRIDDPGDDTDITDGNGIIYDRSASGNSSPPVLIANNVIYQNGGRGIITFMAGNAWIINNTCYMNALDLLLGNDGSGIPDIGDIQIGGNSANNYVFNNIVHAWTIRHAFALMTSSDAMWRRNLWFGGDDLYGIDPGDAADNNQFLHANPVFTAPPAVDPDDGGQYLLAGDPDDLTTEFHLQSSSPAVDYGVDPRTVSGQKIILVDTSEVTDMTDIFAVMTEFLLLDAIGEARDSGGDNWDLGSYESEHVAGGIAALTLDDATLSATGTIDIPLASGLVSYWALDEASGTRNDSHGSNHLTDNATVAGTTGKISNAADFEAGNSEYLSLASNADVQTGDIDFTFAAWVNLESAAGLRTILSKFNNTSNLREYLLDYSATTSRFRFTVSSNGTSTTTVSADNFGAASLATWYFVVAWHDATANTINIQVNNGTPNSAAHTGGVFTGSAAFRIGAAVASGGAPAYFDGLIDEVAFWKRALTDAERTDLYNSGSGRNYAYIIAEGAEGIEGEATITLAAATLSAAGVLPIVGTAEPTLANAAISATATLALAGAASITLAAATATATGALAIVGTSTVTLADATLAAEGALGIDGSGELAVTLDDATLAATGVLPIVATSAVTLDDAELTSAAALAITGALSVTLDDATLEATATFGDVIAGEAAITLDDATVASAGTLSLQAAAAMILGDATVSSTSTLSIAAQAAITLSPATLSSIGTVVILGAATIQLANATLSATGALDFDIPTIPATVYGPASSGTAFGPLSVTTIGDD